MRVIVRKERPHPGAQLRITDFDGHRITAFVTNTSRGQLADLELRHRRRARAEDRIRCAKDTGLANLPLHDFAQNQIWCAIVALAGDLIAWMQTLALTGHPARRWEPKRLRLRLFSIAGRLAVTGRRRCCTWPPPAPFTAPGPRRPAPPRRPGRARLTTATPSRRPPPTRTVEPAPTRATRAEPSHPNAESPPTAGQEPAGRQTKEDHERSGLGDEIAHDDQFTATGPAFAGSGHAYSYPMQTGLGIPGAFTWRRLRRSADDQPSFSRCGRLAAHRRPGQLATQCEDDIGASGETGGVWPNSLPMGVITGAPRRYFVGPCGPDVPAGSSAGPDAHLQGIECQVGAQGLRQLPADHRRENTSVTKAAWAAGAAPIYAGQPGTQASSTVTATESAARTRPTASK